VRLLCKGEDRLEFQLGHREMIHWVTLLGLYPRVPPAHYRLTKNDETIPEAAAGQELLNEALAEQREQHRKLVREFLADPARCQKTSSGGRLVLKAGELEWLLQVLNDIRVGSWVRLGSPESGVPPITATNTHDIWAMEAAGFFESCLLEVLSSES
jgi:hypothetical protein